MGDGTRAAVLAAAQADLDQLWDGIVGAEGLELETAEGIVRDRVQGIGARVLEAGLAARGTGKTGPRRRCACGGWAVFDRYRTKQVQTLLGWMTMRRAAYACPTCGHGHCPLDVTLGLQRDSLSPGLRRLTGRFGALLPFAEAAKSLHVAAGVQLSASTVRSVTERIGTRYEQQVATQIATAWAQGLAPVPTGPARAYVAMDGIRIMSTAGAGREVKVGVVQPVRDDCRSPHPPAHYVAGLESAAAFGPRLALAAHQQAIPAAEMIAVLGDGAEWIWQLAAEHFPGAVHIVDWFHASERIWELGRALHGVGTAETTVWVEGQLARLAQGHAATLATDWQRLPCRGEAATIRDAQVTYFTNQASRLAYDRYRADGWDIGSGMVESACKHLIGARHKGSGRRWSDAGAQAVAAVRGLLFNHHWATYDLAA
jgi:hypothetical protein